MAANMTPISPCGKQRQTCNRVSRFARIRQSRAERRQIRIDNAHRHGRNKPDECPGKKQSAAQQGNFARRTLVIHAEIALRHGAGVVAERNHDRPRGDVEPAKLSGNMNRFHFRRQRMHQAAHSAHPHERHHDENHAKRHQDGGLQKIGDHYRPQSAQHAIENNKRAGADNRPGHRKTARSGNKEAQPKQGAGAGEQLEDDRGPGKNLVRGQVEAAREILHDGGDAAAPPALGEDEVAEQKTQGVSDVESNGRDTRTIGDSGGPGESPSAEAGHETTQARRPARECDSRPENTRPHPG